MVQPSEVDGPFGSLLHFCAEVRPEWIDRNDHMNNSYYLQISQEACLSSIRSWRGDSTPTERSPFGNFVTQALVTYIREIRTGTPIRIQCRLQASDTKRALVYAELINRDTGKLAAVVERATINVQRGHPPRVVPYAEGVYASLQATLRRHADVPYLEGRQPVLRIERSRKRGSVQREPKSL
jgi:acyl-CoA thioester hydrolase